VTEPPGAPRAPAVAPRVLVLTDEFPPDIGGVGRSVARIAGGLRARGYDLEVAVLAEGTAWPAVIEESHEGMKVHRLVYSPGPGDSRQAREAERLARLLRLARERAPALVHAFFVTKTGLPALLAAQVAGARSIASFRGNDLHHGFSGKYLPVLQSVLGRADLVTFVTSEMSELAAALVPDRGNRVVLPNGVEWANPGPARPPRRPATFTVATSGVLRTKKGLGVLLEAIQRLARDVPSRLLFVGDFAADEAAFWRERIAALGCGDLCTVTGFVRGGAGAAYLREADAYVQASLYDGCPNALLEAAAQRLPLVCSDIPPFREMFSEAADECAFFPAEDPNALAAVLHRLADEPERAAAMGENAHRAARRRFSPEVEHDEWASIYGRVLEMGRGAGA
jgi:glycosyltransferase involved in cell wall biosynthesis